MDNRTVFIGYLDNKGIVLIYFLVVGKRACDAQLLPKIGRGYAGSGRIKECKVAHLNPVQRMLCKVAFWKYLYRSPVLVDYYYALAATATTPIIIFLIRACVYNGSC